MEGLEWGILAEIDRAEAFEPLDTLKVYLIILAAILILAITFISNLAAQIFVKPIETLSRAARQVTEGDRDVEVNLNTEDEFGELGRVIEGMARDLRTQTTLVARKNEENEALLLNMLPDRVVARVQQGETQIVDSIGQATVLFVRLSGLAKASQHLSSAQIDTILNRLVDEFDEKAELLGLERQNTISPTYLAICGLSKAYLDSSERTMKLALEMLEILQGTNQEFDLELSLHGGIDCGPLEGGIVGSKRFAYKLWGETISTVTQLSYRAAANNILVTQAVRDRLEDRYMFARYQPIAIEDVGELSTWNLITPASTFSQQASLVQTTFAQLLPQMESTAKLFYERLFEIAPEVRSLFGEDTSVQQRKFASTLQIAVNGLTNLDKLLPVVRDLGRQYAGCGVEEKHYQTVGEALLWALQQQLGDNFTPSVKKAWVTTYNLLSGTMREASLNSGKDRVEKDRVESESPVAVEATEA
ncbi:HAMP domain-containing protein [Oscillatoriales cyanobacterium LEGE 11467]|uniref:HAMP domain-containing protein n=1 Tax=Zarconia navalis LEGE 11467 TaxID=1828826 RepID=A0A928W0N6_9CYAN|nr:HAMP domain-containing protein [Zarconia navalis LEGE 11467]